uniref:A-kinase anchor protein 8-like n=1 Tax=Lepisosteus oculatus TaxID=7918 RepID=W5MIE7_LEPOC|nr:PREDICTED: A-kinase anchor protein 8-like [Lepisosteus oculatus]
MACDMIIPAQHSLLQRHLKSQEHTMNRKGLFDQFKRSSLPIAKSILYNKNIRRMLDNYLKGEDPFTDEAADHEVDVDEGAAPAEGAAGETPGEGGGEGAGAEEEGHGEVEGEGEVGGEAAGVGEGEGEGVREAEAEAETAGIEPTSEAPMDSSATEEQQGDVGLGGEEEEEEEEEAGEGMRLGEEEDLEEDEEEEENPMA